MSSLKPSKYIDLQPFQAWVQQSLPAVYDDSLSYTDLLAKMLAYLNNLVANNNALSTDVTNAINYINNFFESTDFQDKVDDKLNRMASDGSLSRLIQPLFDAYKTQIDEDVANFKNQIDEDVKNFKNQTNQTVDTQNSSIANIQTQQTNLANQQTTLSNRMDTFTSLSEGSTTGDAELKDIRVGANGITYSTAGDAVRGQYSQLKEDFSYFKNTSGYVLKPLNSIHKESIPQGTFLNIGNAISGHRYAIVYTPIFDTPVSIGVMDEASELHDVIDGQTYYSTITASVSGVIRFITQSYVNSPVNIFVYDTTGNDAIQDFVKKALLLVTELKFDYNGRQTITIKSSDNEALNVVRLTGACNVGNIDVCFDSGTYNFSAWYNYVFYMNNRNAFRCEIPIGNGCNYYFNGSTINGTVNDDILQSPLIKTNCSLFGSRTNKGDYMLINGVLTATGTIYTVHDEMSGQSKYNHGYENMVINYISGTQEEAIRKCIGGGTGRYGNVVLKNCILNSDYSHELSFHGYENVLGNVDGTITLNISDSYFGHGIQVDTLPNKEIGTVITVCNSFRSDYADYENNNWTKYSWNNESRVN